LGSTKVVRVDVRVISATNKDLDREISEGRFRRDLYERLVRQIVLIPPLRARLNDIPVLVSHILSQSPTGSTLKFTPKAMKELRRYDWQGNVRELENVVHRIIDSTTSEIVNHKQVLQAIQLGNTTSFKSIPVNTQDLSDNLCTVEKAIIERVLGSSLHQSAAAKKLGIAVSTLRRKIIAHRITIPETTENKHPKKVPVAVTVQKNQKLNSESLLLRKLKRGQQFTVQEAMVMMGNISKKSATITLNKLIDDGRIERIKRGLYLG